MILSGKPFRAEELHADGVVDILAEDGNGENAVYDLSSGKHSRKTLVYESIFKVRRSVFPVHHEELMEISEIWVDTAMRLGPREIRLMERSDQGPGTNPRARSGRSKGSCDAGERERLTGQDTAEFLVPRYSSSAVRARESSSFTSSR